MDCGGGELQLPPGFRFHPTDQELVMYYLCRKCGGLPLAAPVIAEVDLYKFDPWQLPEKTRGGEKEWYFFSPRDRKYPNGSRPNRAAGTGYWKATGADKPVTPAGAAKAVAIKKALVFYAGRPPKGVKTNWIMHEYRLADVDRSARKKNTTLRLDEWVLCRIYNKKGVIERHATVDDAGKQAAPAAKNPPPRPGTAQAWPKAEPGNPPVEMVCFDRWSGDSVPPLHTDSSSSEHVLSPSADMAWDREAESQPSWGGAWDNDWFNVDDSMLLAPPVSPPPVFRDAGAFWDMFAYLQKPF